MMVPIFLFVCIF